MDLSKNILMELILNVVGYLSAGGLMLILYSFYCGRRKATSAVASAGSSDEEIERCETVVAAGGGRGVEFIRLGEKMVLADTTTAERVPTQHAPTVTEDSRRRRIDVIRLARKMIEAGASAEKVRAVLPIPEAELALLSVGKRQSGRGV